MGKHPTTPLVEPVNRPKFVLFGSSIVQFSFSEGGWAAILAHTYARKADIILRGYAGWNSNQAVGVLDQVFPKESATQPSLVIVYFGGNDSTGPTPIGGRTWNNPHVPLEKYLENMNKIATHIKGLSHETRIIFLATPPVNDSQIRATKGDFALLRNNELGRKYSEDLIKSFKGKENIKVIDLFDAFERKPDWCTTCFLDDGIHLSAAGSDIVAAEILKVLEEADWKPHLYYTSLRTEFEEKDELTEPTTYRPNQEDGKRRCAL